jgi:hypothetical protein
MSLFASQVTKPVVVEGHGEFVIRKLNRKRMAKAAGMRQAEAFEEIRQMGGTQVLRELRSMNREELQAAMAEAKEQLKQEAPPAAVEADLFSQYDRTTLIELGVVSWPSGATPSRVEIEDLDAEVEEQLAREVYELSRPRTRTETKNS